MKSVLNGKTSYTTTFCRGKTAVVCPYLTSSERKRQFPHFSWGGARTEGKERNFDTDILADVIEESRIDLNTQEM